uniref:Uncharacterized protein n=1 Tax=Solanum lycopersicum TaxID=4081 RepID=A0A3Q7J2L4_SOLLC
MLQLPRSVRFGTPSRGSWANTASISGHPVCRIEHVPAKPEEGLEVVSRAIGMAMIEALPLHSAGVKTKLELINRDIGIRRRCGLGEKSCKLLKLASRVVKMVQRFTTLTNSGPSVRGWLRPIVERLSRNLYVPKI